MEKTKVHLIGNAHIDPVWLWNKPNGYTEVLLTFRSALDRMKENANYIFTCAGAAYYTWIEETDPEMFEEIRARVKEGRWVIVGGWWIQPDCNMPCGESFARHALYSQRYFEQKFGVKAEIGYNVDSFGHNAMLPQILKKSGFSGYVFMRPGNGAEKAYPFADHAFLWESPDGTQIPAYRLPEDGYNSSPFAEVAEKAKRRMELVKEQNLPQMAFYGVGNHGGGPTRENLKALDELMEEYPEDGYAYSSPNAYFAEMDTEKLQVLRDDLQHHASGCYTSVMKIKELNRAAEAKLMAAEKYWIMAMQLGLKKQMPDFSAAWKRILFNQFHDIMCGCSIKSACDAAQNELGASLSEAMNLENEAVQAIAWNIDTLNGMEHPGSKLQIISWDRDGKGTPAILFNPHSFEVEAPVIFPHEIKEVRDQEGNVIPVQRIRGEYMNCGASYTGIIYAKVPPMGWTVVRAYEKQSTEIQHEKMLLAGSDILENEWTRVTVDPNTGDISSVFDKKEQRELLAEAAHARVVDEYEADTWAHNIFVFHDFIGDFEKTSVELIEEGPVRAVIEIKATYGNSRMRQRLIMYREKPGVYIEYKIHWMEEHKMLKLSFPTVLKNGLPVSSIPYGFMQRRADGRDYPMQKWVALKENDWGLGIASDSRTAYDVENGTLCITALRSPIYADHYGGRELEGEAYSGQGEHEFKLYLTSVKESNLELHKTGEVMASPLMLITGGDHKGTLEMTRSMAWADQPNVEISVVKKAEDGSGDIIVRCHETEGKAAEAQLTIGNCTFKATFGPQEIKTFRINDQKVTETNILEER